MVLIDVYVPSVDKTYDFQLDENSFVKVIIEEISEMIGQKERTQIAGDIEALTLCDRLNRRILPKNASLRECGVCNGSGLLLV